MWLIGIGCSSMVSTSMWLQRFWVHAQKWLFHDGPERRVRLRHICGNDVGSFLTGFLGDDMADASLSGEPGNFRCRLYCGRLAPSMRVLILLRFVMGAGLGAENVVGYAR